MTIAVTAVHACMCQGWEVAVMGVGWVTAVREEGWEVAVTGGGWVTAVWEEGRVLAVTGGLGGGGEGGRSGGGGEGDGCVTIAVTAVHACMCGGWLRDHCSHSRAGMHVRGISA